MTLTHNIVQKKAHENAMNMIRRGLALIAIDPRTETLPDKEYREGDNFSDFWMTAEEVHEVLATLAEYVGEAPYNLFEGGRDCVDQYVVGDALCLAESCTRKPSYQTIGDMEDLSREVFCLVNMIDDPSEYAA